MGGIRWAVADWQEKLYNGMVTNQVSDTEKKTTSAQMLFKKKKKKWPKFCCPYVTLDKKKSYENLAFEQSWIWL